MVEVIPTILTADIREAQEKLDRLEELVKRAQIDIIDGVFAQNRTIDPSAMEGIETTVDLDFHLMTKEPSDWVERSVRGGAGRVIGQVEMMSNQMEFLGKAQELGVSVGLGIDLATPVSALDEAVLASLDVVLVMSVKAGFGGQPFDEKAISKIKQLNEVRGSGAFRICVDGGVTPELVGKISEAGADEVAVGKRLLDGDPAVNIEKYG